MTVDKDETGTSNIDGIKADIRQGKEYEVIALKWGISLNYARKIAKDMQNQGEELIDRRTKEWRSYQFMTKVSLKDILREYRREIRKKE